MDGNEGVEDPAPGELAAPAATELSARGLTSAPGMPGGSPTCSLEAGILGGFLEIGMTPEACSSSHARSTTSACFLALRTSLSARALSQSSLPRSSTYF